MRRKQLLAGTGTVAALSSLGIGVLGAVRGHAEATGQVTAAPPSSTVFTDPDQTHSQFIKTIGESARDLANKNDLYASVMIAQAILESSWGQSGLAAAPNYNLFGIKGSFNNQSVNMATQEDDGTGKRYTINAGFRKYDNYTQSLQDYVTLLNHSMYAGAHKKNAATYQDATKFLTGRYATATDYNTHLNTLIERYHLTDYDKPAGKLVVTTYTVKAGDSVAGIAAQYGVSMSQIVSLNNLDASTMTIYPGQVLKIKEQYVQTQPAAPAATTQTTTNTTPAKPTYDHSHTVVAGDSLASIAKQYKMTTDELKSVNDLQSNLILVGQTLKVR
ncbi:Autolysin [Schleiferilactobacillus shenzhenensis LY-73]|uniref:Peptidoglycan hydrolase n=1 Tax=Schleiferilactobacillus shenzhenensis LY-73 TaxID=1231336 RepID=U4TL57_9LACO|nr:Autolysin [Schleiferilactobacillus shenzhenensis LY-73]